MGPRSVIKTGKENATEKHHGSPRFFGLRDMVWLSNFPFDGKDPPEHPWSIFFSLDPDHQPVDSCSGFVHPGNDVTPVRGFGRQFLRQGGPPSHIEWARSLRHLLGRLAVCRFSDCEHPLFCWSHGDIRRAEGSPHCNRCDRHPGVLVFPVPRRISDTAPSGHSIGLRQ